MVGELYVIMEVTPVVYLMTVIFLVILSVCRTDRSKTTACPVVGL
jgi:hypothetical protein